MQLGAGIEDAMDFRSRAAPAESSEGRRAARLDRQLLLQFPGGAAEPTFYVAGRTDEVILEFRFGQAPIASPP